MTTRMLLPSEEDDSSSSTHIPFSCAAHNVCNFVLTLFTTRKKVIDYLYIELLALIRSWHTCSAQDLASKFRRAEELLRSWGLEVEVIGMTTELTSQYENRLSRMQFPLYVSFAYLIPGTWMSQKVSIFKDLHEDVIVESSLNDYRLDSRKRVLSVSNGEFMQSMQSNMGLAMTQKRDDAYPCCFKFCGD